MDPELLRLATDPEARRDPARVRAAMQGMHRGVRSDVLGSMRTNNLVMTILGSLSILVGLGAGVLALGALIVPSLGVPVETGVASPIFVGMGGLFAGIAFYLRLPPRSLLANGTPALAKVAAVVGIDRSVGITRPGVQATVSRVTMVLELTPPSGAPFVVQHAEMMVAGDLRFVQVGSTVPVRLSPSNPRKLAIDWNAVEG